MPMVRNYNVMINGSVSTNETGKDVLFQVEGDIMAYHRLDALRSVMLNNGYTYIEQAYIGQFDTTGKYALFQYNEVVRYSDDSVDCELVMLVYLSENVYKPDYFVSPEKRDDISYQSIEDYLQEIKK
jgi:hypothetical protein